jgi:type II secretory pathway pseudopilin PulG
MGLSYAQMSQAQKQFVDSQAQQMAQWSGSLQAQVQQQQAQNALEQARLREQEQQFTAQQAQQLAEFGTTTGQNAAQLYAQTYHTLPGYNQYGAYTGQTGTYPAGGGTPGATTPGTYNPQTSNFNLPFSGGSFGWPFRNG